jgi:hypothetical protein
MQLRNKFDKIRGNVEKKCSKERWSGEMCWCPKSDKDRCNEGK